jgi:hypothetical protein
MPADEGQWVVAPSEARIDIRIGREAQLAPEVREALERLAQVLEQQAEVQGYRQIACGVVKIADCAVDIQCSQVINY